MGSSHTNQTQGGLQCVGLFRRSLVPTPPVDLGKIFKSAGIELHIDLRYRIFGKARCFYFQGLSIPRTTSATKNEEARSEF